jgi:hemolysin activation/secretion protein
VVENYGTRETGRVRGLSIARINNWLGRDDVLQVGVSGSEDSRSGFASYSVPVWGFVRLNATASIGNSRIGSGTFGPLNLGTDTNVVSASLRTPILNTERWLFSGEAGGEISFSNTKAGPLRIERRIEEVFAQVDATYYGDTSGLFASLRPSWFRTDIKDNAGRSRDGYSRVTGALFAFKRWGDFDLRARGAWQWSPQNLLPTSKQFSLGGPYSVRGYQTDQFTGDKGFYLGIEARYRLARLSPEWGGNGAVSLLAFADGGAALPFRAASRGFKREDYASAVGAGLEASLFDDRFTIFAGLAQPLDDVHRAIHQNRPRFLFSAALRVPFMPRETASQR